MKTYIYLLLCIALIGTACRDSNSPAVSAIIDSAARRDAVVTDTKGPGTVPHMDTTQLVIDSTAAININGTPLKQGNNAVYLALYDNWLHAYTLVHHLPANLHITYVGTVLMGARGNILDQVTKAQDNMRDYIAKDKYGKKYAALTSQQQSAIAQQHGILFQKAFK